MSLALRSLLEARLVRETDPDPGRPTYGAVFFEPVPEAALVLGFDLGARFLRGAVCDLRGGALDKSARELLAHVLQQIEVIGGVFEQGGPTAGLETVERAPDVGEPMDRVPQHPQFPRRGAP